MDHRRTLQSGLLTAAAIGLGVVALRLGRDLLIPFSLALLLTFLLAPVVSRVQKLGLGRIPAVLIIVALSFGFLGWVGWLASGQVADLARRLPEYRETMRLRISGLADRAGRVLGTATRALQELREGTTPPPEAAPEAPRPLPVEVVNGGPDPFGILTGVAGPAIELAGGAAVVLLLVVFFLLYHADLRDRLIQVVGASQVHVTTQAMNEAGTNVSRYLLAQSIVNGAHGTAVALGLFALGIPNALLWGFLAALLRYIPYLGPWMGAAFPVFLSLAAFPGWTRPALVVAFFLLLELVTNNLLEPWLYGNRSGLSPPAVVLATIFWSWLWGGVGLILAIPITVCMVVVARHVPRLRFLHTLLGREPELEEERRLYQRLLAGDAEAAAERVDAVRAGRSPEALCDGLLLPVLALAKHDRRFGDLDERQVAAVLEGVREIMEELMEEPAAAAQAAGRPRIVCVAAADEADRLVAEMLARLLAARGYRTAVIPEAGTEAERAERAAELRPDVAVISALPPGAAMAARRLLKDLGARAPRTALVVGFWTARADLTGLERRIGGRARLAGDLAGAIRGVEEAIARV
jgi:predicted PurR-regulated permease PerM/methylmalonyl-CoA mutase cobalamin-binding subunit